MNRRTLLSSIAAAATLTPAALAASIDPPTAPAGNGGPDIIKPREIDWAAMVKADTKAKLGHDTFAEYIAKGAVHRSDLA